MDSGLRGIEGGREFVLTTAMSYLWSLEYLTSLCLPECVRLFAHFFAIFTERDLASGKCGSKEGRHRPHFRVFHSGVINDASKRGTQNTK